MRKLNKRTIVDIIDIKNNEYHNIIEIAFFS